MAGPLVLVINPGSTSTKVALAGRDRIEAEETLRHSLEELARFPGSAPTQAAFRTEIVRRFLSQSLPAGGRVAAVIGRGGLLKPVPAGVYRVSEAVLADCRESRHGDHASNLGALIAAELASELAVASFIADPPIVDELAPVARISGFPGIERVSRFHALNIRYVARRVARDLARRLDECSFVAAHLGGGTSVVAIRQGRVVDCNDALLGAGPFSPERAGTLPLWSVIELCFSGRYTRPELERALVKRAGFVGYLGTNDSYAIEMRALAGEEPHRSIWEAYCYQVAKEIGAMAAALGGTVDRVILTGGLARAEPLRESLRQATAFIAPLVTVPGELEMEALAEAAFLVLDGQEEARDYE